MFIQRLAILSVCVLFFLFPVSLDIYLYATLKYVMAASDLLFADVPIFLMLCKLSYYKHYAIRARMKKTYHIYCDIYVRMSVKAKFLMALPHYNVVLPFLCHLIR